MKIYSNFNDYYDHCTGFYSDENKWIRKTRIETFRLDKLKYQTKYTNKTEDLLCEITKNCRIGCISGKNASQEKADDEAILVGFCGKVYPAFLFYERISAGGDLKFFRGIDRLKGGYIDLSKFMKLRNKDEKDKKQARRFEYNPRVIDYTEFSYHNHPDLDSVFVDLNSPIFIVRKGNFCPARDKQSYVNYGDYGNLIVNPCLSDFGLQSSFEPFYANQEIEMYLGNQLTQRDSCDIKRTDELIRDSKGFYDMSFKKRK